MSGWNEEEEEEEEDVEETLGDGGDDDGHVGIDGGRSTRIERRRGAHSCSSEHPGDRKDPGSYYSTKIRRAGGV